jgi:hypothetical protein
MLLITLDLDNRSGIVLGRLKWIFVFPIRQEGQGQIGGA